jgi:transposase
MNATTYGLDVAKQVFQMYWVEAETGEIVNWRFRRDELIAFLAQRPAGRVALEACGSAHWWAREIKALGHLVVLLHAKFIRPFVQTNKTDAADARAIWTAVHQPGMRAVFAVRQVACRGGFPTGARGLLLLPHGGFLRSSA